MRNWFTLFPIVLALAVVPGCAGISPEAQERLDAAVSCETAEQDVAVLEAAVGRRITRGYRQIDEKILQIRITCEVFEGEPSEEGLYAVSARRVGFLAVSPGIDLSLYQKLMVPDVLVTFKDDRKNYRLNEAQIDRVRRYFHEELEKELANGGYDLTDEPGSDVLFLRPLLVDVMVTRPPERGSARDRTWVSSSGEVTLIVELRDSLSGKLLARAADRRAVQGVGGYMERSISTTEIANVRRLFNSWARLLRQRLDTSKDLAQTHD